MKYLPLIVRNVLRNKIRSLFTGASIAMSLFLVVTLYSLLTHQEEITDATKLYNRLAVLHKAGLAGRLPIAYLDRVRRMPGVKVAAPMSWFGGNYREETVQFAQFGTDPETIFDVYAELEIPPEQLETWKNDRTGCIVGSLIAANKGWKIGDKIPLQGNIYPVDLELTVDGIYDGPSTADKEWVLFHFAYMDEALKELRDPSAGNAGIPDASGHVGRESTGGDAGHRGRIRQFRRPREADDREAIRSVLHGDDRQCQRVHPVHVDRGRGGPAVRGGEHDGHVVPRTHARDCPVQGDRVPAQFRPGVVSRRTGRYRAARWCRRCARWQAHCRRRGSQQTRSRAGPVVCPVEHRAVWGGIGGGIGLVSGIIPAWRAAHISVIDGLRKIV